MSEWTPETLRKAHDVADKIMREGNPLLAVVLHDMARTIEAQQVELMAARQVCNEFNRAIKEVKRSQSKGSNRQQEVFTLNVLLSDTCTALDEYNALRQDSGEEENS